MSTHEEIVQEMRRQVDVINVAGARDLSPEAIATAAYRHFATGDEDLHIRHGCIESYKSMARRILAREFGSAEELSESVEQADMFAGHLQERYPIRTPAGSEPVYRIREALSDSDLEWNVQRLLKISASARKHAEALSAYRLSRKSLGVAA